ncbi:alpha/beta fold hydrolase [Bacillus salitolerans]|uniref:Alpha/beta fold hydrolase n=1 Tax=Bacillus salitolerans TaxID=1437434 RepID=A0ABW4LNX5_9BACI
MTIMTETHFTTTLKGIDLHYEVYHHRANQQKPTFVLIHGFLSSTFSYRRLIPLLAKEYRVVAVDLPPFGKSGKSNNFIYSNKNLASLIIGLLDLLGIKDIILVGHSMGGQIALNMIKQKPEYVRNVILLCSSGYLKKSKRSLVLSSYLPFFASYLKYYLAKQGVLHNLRNVVFDHTMIDEEMMLGYEQPFYNNQIFNALAKMIRHREGDLSSKDLQEIDTKSLLIWGTEDKVVPLHIGERLHEDLRNSKLITYEKTGHLLPEEKPFHIKEQILEFI